MKAIKGGKLSLAVITVITFLAFSHSASQAQPWVSIITEKGFNAEPVPAEKIPDTGSFWSFQRTNYPPLPFLNFPELPVYYLGYGNAFLVDDSTVDYQAIYEQREAERALRRLEIQYGLREPDEFDAEDGGGPMEAAYEYPASNYLWLEITSVTNGATPDGLAFVTLHGTVPGTAYELLSKEALTNTIWASEGIVIGAEDQDWTPTIVAVGSRTNSLFLWAKSWADSDGDGLPDWYENEVSGTDPWNPDTGNTGVSDGYKDGDNDGWTNLQEYQNGTSPVAFNTPPAPQGFSVTLISAGQHANLTWQAAGGDVTGYTIERSFTNATTQLSSSATSLADNSYTLPTGLYFTVPKYRIQANYSAGNSAWGPWTSSPESLPPDASIVSSSGGEVLLLAASLAPNASALRSGQWYTGVPQYSITNVDVSASAFTNGRALMPEPFATLTSTGAWYAQWVYTNGIASAAIPLGWAPTIPFWDGRQQLKQNLVFLLRAATVNYSFGYNYDDGIFAPYFISSPTAYAYAGLYETYYWAIPSGYPEAWLEEFRPFEENHRYRNFAFSATNLSSSGHLTTGVYWESGGLPTLDYPPLQLFDPPATVGPIPALLGNNEAHWPYWTEFVPRSEFVSGGLWDELGISYQAPNLVMAAGARNLFGLPYESVKLAWGGSATYTATLNAGGSTPYQDGFFYPATGQPAFQTVNYYFGRPWIDWLPGHVEFSPTNTTPLLVTGVGQPIELAGYAKLAITNGYTNKFAYLGQYFDKALKIGTNGAVTTNQTGILSPYGEFFPTEPGRTALVTMPDLDTGERGTATVYVVSMNLDANHDGVMDRTFFGPDHTSATKPFRFWVNNNKDSGDTGGDGTPGHRIDGDITSDTLIGSIHGRRDLVDFFPVYLNLGGLLQVASNVTILLKQADSALFFIETSLTPTNYMNYLRDTNFYSSLPYGFTATLPIGPGGRGLSQDFYNNIRTNNGGIILVEASKPTTAPLVMEIWQGTNLLAQTSAYLSIDDVETMYRHKNLMLYQTANSLRGPADRLTAPNEPDTQEKNFVFVHGYNVNPYQATGWFADMFKRLYWSGSQAKFYGVTWDGAQSQVSLWPLPNLTPNYHTNVYNAFLTASNLANFLGTLTNGPTVLAGHSLGNMVCLSAISDWNAPVSKYFMVNAAVPTEAIDASISATVPMIHPDWGVNGNYARRLWASSWYGLFSPGDGRNLLTWSNRLANLPFANIYNFYSSGEEVLRQYEAGPPLDGIGTVNLLVDYWNNHPPLSSYAWVWQEKGKGRSPVNNVLGSSHGGWKFNASYDTNSAHLPYTQANALPDSQLRTNAFFDFVSSSFSADSALYGASASTYATANRNRILADAIPALTLPIGANPVPILTPQNGDDQNFDMQALFENGWPSGRPQRQFGAVAPGEWHHSDIRELAYTFTYPFFNKMVILGDLK